MCRSFLALLFYSLALMLPSSASWASGKIVPLNSSNVFDSFNSCIGTTFIVGETIGLRGRSVTVGAGCTLSFTGKGCFKNGIIVGSGTKVEGMGNSLRFNKVRTDGTWHGTVSDANFKFGGRNRHYYLISSLFKFSKVTLRNRKYYLERWETISLGHGNVFIEGNGAQLIITSDKGPSKDTDWGRVYVTDNLFLADSDPGCKVHLRDLKIVDNASAVKGWGENINSSNPVKYNYFYVYSDEIIFENVSSDGSGCLLGTYNTSRMMKQVVLDGCNIRTSEFAVELANRKYGKSSGHNAKVVVRNCEIFRRQNAEYVGCISLVGDGNQLDSAVFVGNKMTESNCGNIELTGVSHVVFKSNNCYNSFCFSGDSVPLDYVCTDNIIHLRSAADVKKPLSLSICGKAITMCRNKFIMEKKPFPFIEVSFPEKVQSMSVTDNDIVYEPEVNSDEFACLFAFDQVAGKFVFDRNKFETSHGAPHFCNYFPASPKNFSDAFQGLVNNHR